MTRFQALTNAVLDQELEMLREHLGLAPGQKAELLREVAALAAWWSTDARPVAPRALGTGTWIFAAGLLALVASCMTGAVTALGDTLFPVGATEGVGLFERVTDELSPANHFLVRLRIIHPVVAVVAAGIVYGVGAWAREHARDARGEPAASSGALALPSGLRTKP